MRMIWLGVLALAGCSAAGDFVGSPHGYIGDIKTPIGLDIEGVPTIVPDGTSPMGYRKTDATIEDAYSMIKTPQITATGPAAIITACAFTPEPGDCVSVALGN